MAAAPEPRERKKYNFRITDYALDVTFWEELYATTDSLLYVLGGKEICPTTGRPHFQMWVHFRNQRSLAGARRLFYPRDTRVCDKSVEANEKYCRKDGQIVIELGSKPRQGRRTDLEDIRKMIKDGKSLLEIADSYFDIWCQYRRSFEMYAKMCVRPRAHRPEVYVYWGDPGTSKSKMAAEKGAIFVTHVNGFWMGLPNGAEKVCLDDFEPANMSRTIFLRMADRYAFQANTKGSHAEFVAKEIYITSNSSPITWYMGSDAVMRRIKEIRQFTVADGGGYCDCVQPNELYVPDV